MAIKLTMDKTSLNRLGLAAIATIIERTQSGIGADGAPFPRYSSRPFSAPYSAFTKKAVKLAVKATDAAVFTTKEGGTWVLWKNGYINAKKYISPKWDGSTVNLTNTFKMLGALTVVSVDANNNSVVIGFTRAEEAQKAYYNAQRGRVFLGLSEEDKLSLAKQLKNAKWTVR